MADTQEWLNPLNKMKIQAAVKEHLPRVILSYANKTQVMKLTYIGDTVHFAPMKTLTSDFVPCGYFNIKTILHSTWLLDD